MQNANDHSGSGLGRRARVLGALSLLAFGVGCGSKAPADDGAGSSTQAQLGADYCQAAAVIRESCLECHGAARKYGAPMSLLTYADLAAPGKTNPQLRVLDLMALRIHDTAKPMPPVGFPITPQGIAVIDGWLAGGALPPVDPTCATTGAAGSGGGSLAGSGAVAGADGSTVGVAGTTGGTAGMTGAAGSAGTDGSSAGTSGGGAGASATDDEWPADCEERFTFVAHATGNPSAKYTVAAGQESHPQFYFDAPWGTDTVQAVKFRPITDNATVLHHWILYGGGSGLSDAHLTGWAPGKEKGTALPANVGMYLPNDGSQLRLDVHYNNVGSTSTAQDASGVEVCITRSLREHTAAVIGLTASATSAAHTVVTNKATCTAQVTGGPVHLMSVSPHMHRLGTYSALRHTAGGVMTTLHEGAFDFEDQQIYPLGDVVVNNGDSLTTECTYDNTTDSTVRFGQNTSDEMCFNFTVYYPMGALRCSSFGL